MTSDPLERALLERIAIALEKLADQKRSPVLVHLPDRMSREQAEEFIRQWKEVMDA
jgi:hypothetical protein